jgi:hypothetical protein
MIFFPWCRGAWIGRAAFAGALAVAPGAAAAAGAAEHWEATSTTAMSITGNVTFTPEKIVFQNGRSLPLSFLGHVAGFKAMGETADAAIYRVTSPADPTLRNGNHLCGGAGHAVPVTFVAVWVPTALPGDATPRSMAAFSGKDAPRSAEGDDVCGTFNYDLGFR